MPQVDFPTVQVSTQLPGASPDVIASLITAPLERQLLGQIPSLSEMTSTSSFGVSQISLQFDLNRDIDGATQDVQAAINAAAGILPKTLPYPPVYAKVNPADAPVMTLALTSDTVSLRAMSDLADTILGQRLSQISGVGRVAVARRPETRGAGAGRSGAACRPTASRWRTCAPPSPAPNVSGPKGSLDGAQQAYTHRRQRPDRGRRRLPSHHHRLSQRLAGHDRRCRPDRRWPGERPHRRLVSGHTAVIIDIQRSPAPNVIDVVSQIRAEIPKLQRAIPAGVTLTIVSDRTVTIRASVHDVQFTLLLSVVLVTLVVLLFLRSLRATSDRPAWRCRCR